MKRIAGKRATEMALATVALAVLLAGQLVADEGTRVFDVPKLNGIVIDGTADDWKEAGFHVDVMTSVDGWVRPVSDMDTYGTAELYDWLLGQVRGKPGQPPATAQQTGSK